MKKSILLPFLLFSILSFSQIKKQKDSIPAIQINLSNTNYKDFVVVDKLIYAITRGDSLVVLNLKTSKVNQTIQNVFSVAKTSKNQIYYVNSNNEIILTKDLKEKRIIDKVVEGKYSKLVIDKNQDCIVITSDGIFLDHKIYLPKSESNIFRVPYKSKDQETKKLKMPDLVYLDKENRLWLTYDNGEFGEDIWFFDLKTKEFYEDNYLSVDVDYPRYPRTKENDSRYFNDLLKKFPNEIKITEKDTLYKFPCQLPIHEPIRGIAENKKGDLFLSQSLMHFMVDSYLATIKRYDNHNFYSRENLTQLLDFETLSDTIEGEISSFRFVKEYLGPINYNRFNDKIYYYSDKGFFKIVEKNNKYSKEFVFKPWVNWTYGLQYSIGYQMNVIKFEFLSEKEIVFLTSNNGIGYFDGKTVKYFR